jgi:hypothetical protein
MARKQKPPPDLVSKADRALKTGIASKQTIKRLAAIVLDDQEYDPRPHRAKKATGSKKHQEARLPSAHPEQTMWRRCRLLGKALQRGAILRDGRLAKSACRRAVNAIG